MNDLINDAKAFLGTKKIKSGRILRIYVYRKSKKDNEHCKRFWKLQIVCFSFLSSLLLAGVAPLTAISQLRYSSIE
jgi:hypothetical protein